MSLFDCGSSVSANLPTIKQRDVVGLGYCGWDYLCLVPEIPLDQKVQAIAMLAQGGGPAATAIYAAQTFGARTAFVGAVGDDENGGHIRQELQQAGVDVSGIAVRPQSASPVAFCWVVQRHGKRSIVWSHGTTRSLAASELNVELIQSSRILHLDGHQTEAAIAAAKLARHAGVAVCLDAGTLVSGIDQIIQMTDVLIASENFAQRYTGQSNLEAALQHIAGQGPRWVVVTSGEQGSLGWDGQTLHRVAAFPVQVVDTTGAGDVYHGAFIYRQLQGANLPDCMRFASAAAALKCQKLGGRTGIPSLTQLQEFLCIHGSDDLL